MKNYEKECAKRVQWIQEILEASGAKGIIFGNSGGKDSALVGILCKLATEHVLGVIMPCGSKQNYGDDTVDAIRLSDQFDIKTQTVDLTETRNILLENLSKVTDVSEPSKNNINPRLRMTALYAIGQSLGYLVAGTGNKSERYMGYFTKWGDGGFDFNPISDLSVEEVFEFLRYLNAPRSIIEKEPSAGLFDGQTDEKEMGVTYAAIDEYIENGTGDADAVAKIKRAHETTAHKRILPIMFDDKS